MSHPAVEWTLDAIQSNWSTGLFSHIPLERIDRDESQLLEGNIRKRTAELKDSNYVGVGYTDKSSAPVGTEFDLDVETVVSVRIEGLHADQWGFVDPDGSMPPATAGDPVPWSDLVTEIKNAIWAGREWPDAGRSEVTFTHLLITNEAPQSSHYSDYFRHDFDIILSGFEELP